MNRTILFRHIAAIFFPMMLTAQVLNVPLVFQEQNEWCWDATSCCVLGYYGIDVDQCVVAEYTRTHAVWHDFGTVNCCDDPSQGCNYPNQMWGDPGSAQAVMQHWGVDNYGTSPLTILQIQAELAFKHPFIMLWEWTTGGGHALVGYGLDYTFLYYMDPWPGDGYAISDYTWVLASSDHYWAGTNVITTDYIDNPLPPSNLTAYSDFQTPTSAVLRWTDPTMMRSGLPISDFRIRIYRDSTLVGEVNPGIMTYTDTGLTNHALCRYRVRAIASLVLGSAALVSCYAGGSAVPEAPPALWAKDGEDGVHLSWKNPSRQMDGTPLNDMHAILVYRDGVLVDSILQTSADTGEVRQHIDLISGYHWYVLRTRDSELPMNTSIPTDSVLAFGGAGHIYTDDFEQGPVSLYRTGAWDTTHSLAYSGAASLTDSPEGKSMRSDISYALLAPVILTDESLLRFHHIAIVDPASSLAIVEISVDGRKTFKQLASYNWNAYPEWADSIPNPQDWKLVELDLRPYLYDTVTIRLRMITTTGNMGDGWYIDSVSVGLFNPVESITTPVSAGWNLLSLPIKSLDYRCADVYPCAVSSAFTYTGSYEHIDSLYAGSGFWLKFDSAAAVSMTGRPFTRDSIPVMSGWNIIGALSTSVGVTAISTRPRNILASSFYSYSGGYDVATSLDPGRGYWIRSRQSGAIILSSYSSNFAENPEPGSPLPGSSIKANRLVFQDAVGRLQTLTFAAGDQANVSLKMYDLPPIPPDGAFDVRFKTQRSHAFLNPSQENECEIDLEGIHYPLTIRWQIMDDGAGSWTMTRDSSRIQMRTQGSTVITIPPARLALRAEISGQQDLPRMYALRQNFPNPFNPTTIIKYELPAESFVSIKVINILGEVVKVLVDGIESPGYKSVQWDAENAASGIYFCRMHAEATSDHSYPFTELKKMVVVR